MKSRGYTLIEIILAVAIGTILLGLTVTAFKSAATSQSVDKSAEIVVSALNEARSSTLSSKEASSYGVHFGTTDVTLFKGPTYVSGVSTNQVRRINQGTTISNITLSGGGSDVIFTRLTGGTTQTGTLVVKNTASTTSKTITISGTGNVDRTQ